MFSFLFAAAMAAEPLDTTAALFGQALASDEAYDDLRELCDNVGHRLSGSPQLDQAIAWAEEKMKEDGLTTRLEPVQIPKWVRGMEKLTVLEPSERNLEILALGNSPGTKKKGIEGEVVIMNTFEQLETNPAEVEGKIVLYDVPFTSYGETVGYRWEGAPRAAKLGAKAVLMRSVTPKSLTTPHTGATDPDDTIPSAAVTVEDAAWMRRIIANGGNVRVNLQLGSHFEDDVLSHNVVGEVKGRELPDEIVVVGCHLDSWDVGHGAQDDGAGCVMAMQAGALIARLPQPPRRTVRVVLYTNEENGLRGGKKYAEVHSDQIENHVALIESDTGSGRPLGFRIDVRHPEDNEAARDVRFQQVVAHLGPVQHLLSRIEAGELKASYSGADIGPSVSAGALGFGLSTDMTNYWPIHHTHADTFEKVDAKLLAHNTAAVTALTYWLAEAETRP
jgi:carboxypeptidase Q